MAANLMRSTGLLGTIKPSMRNKKKDLPWYRVKNQDMVDNQEAPARVGHSSSMHNNTEDLEHSYRSE